MPLGVFLLGKSKFWLILFYSHMTNYPLNISIWKFMFIIFYPTTSCLHTFSFPFMSSLNHLLWKSWIHAELFSSFPFVQKVNKFSRFFIWTVSPSLSLPMFLTVQNRPSAPWLILSSIPHHSSLLSLRRLKLSQLMILSPCPSSACLTFKVNSFLLPSY